MNLLREPRAEASPCRRFFCGELERIASRASAREWLQSVRDRKADPHAGRCVENPAGS